MLIIFTSYLMSHTRSKRQILPLRKRPWLELKGNYFNVNLDFNSDTNICRHIALGVLLNFANPKCLLVHDWVSSMPISKCHKDLNVYINVLWAERSWELGLISISYYYYLDSIDIRKKNGITKEVESSFRNQKILKLKPCCHGPPLEEFETSSCNVCRDVGAIW